MHQIVIYTPLPRSQRFKIFIPYQMKAEREWLKAQNSSFYHPSQKLWSMINTPENKRLIAKTFKGKYQVQSHEQPSRKLPKAPLSEACQEALVRCEQKFILKSFSTSTVKNYVGALAPFFSFFKERDFQDITKE